jgi:hypothetical protein
MGYMWTENMRYFWTIKKSYWQHRKFYTFSISFKKEMTVDPMSVSHMAYELHTGHVFKISKLIFFYYSGFIAWFQSKKLSYFCFLIKNVKRHFTVHSVLLQFLKIRQVLKFSILLRFSFSFNSFI